MLLTNMATPTSLIVAIWGLRSVPISMLVLMFVFNSGSIRVPEAGLHFWFDAIAIAGMIGILSYWNRFQRIHWSAGLVMYSYILLALVFRNPYGILTTTTEGGLTIIKLASAMSSLSVGLGIFAVGILLEILIYHLRQYKIWAWRTALGISILYVSSIVFFFSGTLGIWCLLDSDTKQAFKRRLRLLSPGK